MDDIFAGIVLYNPNLDRLIENISSISKQVRRVIVVDNGSNRPFENENISKKFDNVRYINLKGNRGIAAALNVIAEECEKNNVNWVLTLDQDTVCCDNIVEKYQAYLNLKNVGQITCLYKDRNFPNEDDIKQEYDGIREIPWCITSAALLNIEAWRKVGGFDEKLFIDQVDYDICLTMREMGYRIYQIGFVGFIHEIGQGRRIEIGPFCVKTWNHSAFRRYYGVRNAIIVASKHRDLNVLKAILGAIKHIFIILILEDDKKNKLAEGIRGLWDGIRVVLHQRKGIRNV